MLNVCAMRGILIMKEFVLVIIYFKNKNARTLMEYNIRNAIIEIVAMVNGLLGRDVMMVTWSAEMVARTVLLIKGTRA